MRSTIAKIAIAVLIGCLLTLILGADTSSSSPIPIVPDAFMEIYDVSH